MPSLSLSTPALVRSTPSEPPSARIRQQIMTSIRRTVCFSYSSTSPESKTVKNEMYFKNVNRKKTKTKAMRTRRRGIFLDDSGRGKLSVNNNIYNNHNPRLLTGEIGGGGGGGGGNFGGNSGGGGWNNNNNNNNDDERFSQSSSMATRFLLAATVTFLLTVVPLANAKSSNAAANKMKAQTEKAFQSLPTKAKDFFTSMLYGFVIFYGVKMALKSFFAPVALFSFTMCILHNMKVLPFGPMEMYESWVRPYLPREFQKGNAFLYWRRYDFGKIHESVLVCRAQNLAGVRFFSRRKSTDFRHAFGWVSVK